ncbi:MAG: NAD(P)-dependent oxidoreductase [Dysgonamonadaceae bacterium]|nr:NAD(P)-dependent oxidoreductase [Dysgonamonadaceae bacterium]
MNILITGATGFIGSNIAEYLIDRGHRLIATYRNTSTFEKINNYKERIIWIESDNDNFVELIKVYNPDMLIHTAWSGIDTMSRNNWDLQLKNFYYSKKLIEDSINVGVRKIIVLGSQAEYGIKGFKVDEETLPEPNDAYGAVKLLLLHFFKTLCEKEKIEWYWVRVFSLFGKNENDSWLIPSVITRLRKEESILLTKGEQEYNYLYIEDFLNRFYRIVIEKQDLSGVYNICNDKTVKLKELLISISEILGVSSKLLEFGSLPYREGQNMFISGSCRKFKEKFKYEIPDNDLLVGLEKTIALKYNK